MPSPDDLLEWEHEVGSMHSDDEEDPGDEGYFLGRPLEAFVSFFHPLLLAPRLPFLPLLAISVYSAVGVHLAAALALQLWLKLRRDGCDNP